MLQYLKKHPKSDFLILLAILLVSMWQLVLLKATMKWDLMDLYLPWKHFITEALKNGTLPLWNPFMNGGFSQMGDPGTWYPVSWAIGMLHTYNVTSVHFEYLLHLYLAGAGFYMLVKQMGFSRSTAIITASSYMLSGFFIGNAQHLGWLVGAAWLPFAVYYVTQLFKSPEFTTAIKLGLVMFFILSGAYPGMFIVSAYIILAYFLVYTFQLYMPDRKLFINWLKYCSIAAIVFVITGLVVLLSSFDLSQHLLRGDGLGLHSKAWGALTGSLPPNALLSILFPYSVTSNTAHFWTEDLTLLNCYFGWALAILYILFFTFKTSPLKTKVWALLGLFFFMVAMANQFPFRVWMYHTLPFMNMFRFSTLFRLFAIFYILLTVAYMLDQLKENERLRKRLAIALGVLIGILITGMAVLFFYIQKWQFKDLILNELYKFGQEAGIPEKIFLQGVWVVLLAGTLYLFLKKGFYKKYWHFFGLLLMLDIVVATQLNAYGSVFSKFAPKSINKVFTSLPLTYPLPSNKVAMADVSEEKYQKIMPYLWRNLPTYFKTPSADGNSPYTYKHLRAVIDSGVYENMTNKPLFFISYKNKVWEQNKKCITDSLATCTIQITKFGPNHIACTLQTVSDRILVLNQLWYPYWRAKVNGQENVIAKTNMAYMSVMLENGTNTVEFEFDPKHIKYAFYFSYAGFLIFVFILLVIGLKRYYSVQQTLWIKLWIPLLSALMLLFAATHILYRLNNRNPYLKINEAIQKIASSDKTCHFLLCVDQPDKIKTNDLNNYSFSPLSIFSKQEYCETMELIDKNSKQFCLIVAGTTTPPELKNLITENYPCILEETQKAGYSILHCEKCEKGNSVHFASNDFEKQQSQWSFTAAKKDTTTCKSGQASFFVDSLSIYASTWKIKPTEANFTKGQKIGITLYVKPERLETSSVAFQVIREDKTYIWKTLPIKPFICKPTEWNRFFWNFEFNEDFLPNDEIKIFVWNPSKDQFNIDDFEITVK